MAAASAGTLEEDLTVLWTLLCAFFVFFMQSGFALLESGSIRNKNVKNVLLKNVVDASIAVMCWWAVGYAFAYGDCEENGFIGYANFFSSDSSSSGGLYWALWMFRWAFSATATTIVSGAVAERCQFRAYAAYTGWMTAFIYPVVVHWVWSNSGWLSASRRGCDDVEYSPYFGATNGLLDWGGAGVVHMVGGGAALMGATVLGPRLGRFLPDPVGGVSRWEPSSPTNMALGVFILWLGWYGFNAGSVKCFTGCMSIAAKIAVNTTLSVGASALTCLLLAVVLGDAGDIGPLLNGVMAGAVSITGACALVQEYAAFVIGVVAAFVYTGSSKLLLRLRIDDPLDASPVHFFCGIWGLLAPGFFATETNVQAAYHYANDWGVFYGGSGRQLGVQVLGVVSIAAWTCSLSALAFLLLRKVGWLRVPREVEIAGLDFAQGLQRSRLRQYTADIHRAHDAAPAAELRDAEGAQHGARSADLVLHGRPAHGAAAAVGQKGWQQANGGTAAGGSMSSLCEV